MRMVRVGCGDYGSEFNMSSDGSLHGRKLRPLMPRPTSANFSPIPNPNSSIRTPIHKANLSTLNGNLGTYIYIYISYISAYMFRKKLKYCTYYNMNDMTVILIL